MDEKTPIDAVAITVGAASFFQWIPAVASLATLVWMMIRIYETRTVQNLLTKLGVKK